MEEISYVLIITWIILLILLYSKLSHLKKRLKIVRMTNALEEWNHQVKDMIRENRWEEVYEKLEKIRKTTIERIEEFENLR
jgi:hypothetical protein